MAEIMHRIQVNASPAQVFDALTDQAALGGWFSRAREVDRLAELRFGRDKVVAQVRVQELQKSARIVWQCVGGPSDWIGTDITFDLAPEGNDTVVRFRHRNWKEASDFMGHCSTEWAYFLLRLKSVVETPEPDDVLI